MPKPRPRNGGRSCSTGRYLRWKKPWLCLHTGRSKLPSRRKNEPGIYIGRLSTSTYPGRTTSQKTLEQNPLNKTFFVVLYAPSTLSKSFRPNNCVEFPPG